MFLFVVVVIAFCACWYCCHWHQLIVASRFPMLPVLKADGNAALLLLSVSGIWQPPPLVNCQLVIFSSVAVTTMHCCPHVFYYFAASVGAKLIFNLKCFCFLLWSCHCAILMLSHHCCSLLMIAIATGWLLLNGISLVVWALTLTLPTAACCFWCHHC